MKWLQVRHSAPLRGCVRIPGSKNSSLALLAAACMAEEPVILKGIPNILDYRVIEDIALQVGIVMKRDVLGDVHIDPRGIRTADLDRAKTSAYRASYYFIGALLAKIGRVSIGYPGGDDFVSRPIDQHVKALKALGATFTFERDHYVVEARKLKGDAIFFDTITSGGTMNAILTAVLAEGETILRNAAVDPEVVDTAQLLNAMGAKISGAGTDTIRIKGVKSLHGCTYTVIPDRLIAGAFLMAAGATRGTVTVEDVIPEHLGSCLSKLAEIGIACEASENSVTAFGDTAIRATRIRTGMYPAFATDLQQPMTALLLRAQGRSIVTDKVYKERYAHVQQLKKLGAHIEMRRGSAFIQGGQPLMGASVHATDVRAGTCLLIAGLMAEGITEITGIEHIERGYEDIIGLFRSLGAELQLVEGRVKEFAQVSGLSAERA